MIWFGPTNCTIISTIIFTIIIIISLTFCAITTKSAPKKVYDDGTLVMWSGTVVMWSGTLLMWSGTLLLWLALMLCEAVSKYVTMAPLRCDLALLCCLVAPLWCEAVSTKNGDNFRELSPRLWRLLHTSKIKIFYTNSNRPLIQQKSRKEVEKIEAFWKLLRLSDPSLLLFLPEDMMIRKKWKSHPKSMWMKCI